MIHGSAVHALKKISFGDDKMISASVETLNIWESLLKVKAWLGIKGTDSFLSIMFTPTLPYITRSNRQFANLVFHAISVKALDITKR